MTNLQRLKAKAKQLGCTVKVHRDSFGTNHEVLVDPPDDFVFSASDVHQLVQAGENGETVESLCADALERLDYGIERCNNKDCEVCDAV